MKPAGGDNGLELELQGCSGFAAEIMTMNCLTYTDHHGTFSIIIFAIVDNTFVYDIVSPD
jgi:hypothetical protein